MLDKGARDGEKESKKRGRRVGGMGGRETRMQQIQVKALCRYQEQEQESRTHTSFNVCVMVKTEWNWGLKPERKDMETGKRERSMRLTRSDKWQGNGSYVATQ